MSTTKIQIVLLKAGRFLLPFLGCAVTLLVTAIFISMLDAWFVSKHFALPFQPSEEPLAGLGYLTLAAFIATTALLAITAIPLILLKRESVVAYLILCGGVSLVLLVLPATEGNVFVLACAAMFAGAFWWFSYRRNRCVETAGRGPAWIAWLVLLCGVIAFLGIYWTEYRAEQVAAAERERTRMEPTPLGGAVIGQSALLYDFRGRLFAYNLQNGGRQLLQENGVIDVESVGDGSAWILSVPPLPDGLDYDSQPPAGSFTVSRFREGRIEELSSAEFAANERPFTIAIRNGAPILIGPHAAFLKDSGSSQWRKVEFDQPISKQLANGEATTLISGNGDNAFVGLNIGEWGGGLVRIDLANGLVRRIESRGPDLCDGPLNSDCDPVTGLVLDPDDDRCVLASVGLSHFLMHGRILRVCGEDVTVELTLPVERPSQAVERFLQDAATGSSQEPMDTEAFFALIRTHDGSIWAISPFAAYRKEGTNWSRHSLPKLEQRGSLHVSEELPGIFLLSSWRNARNSLSGPTPMAFAVN